MIDTEQSQFLCQLAIKCDWTNERMIPASAVTDAEAMSLPHQYASKEPFLSILQESTQGEVETEGSEGPEDNIT